MNAETTLQSVRELAEGQRLQTPNPRRRITYQLTRAGRPLRTLADVQNPLALPLGQRLLWRMNR